MEYIILSGAIVIGCDAMHSHSLITPPPRRYLARYLDQEHSLSHTSGSCKSL